MNRTIFCGGGVEMSTIFRGTQYSERCLRLPASSPCWKPLIPLSHLFIIIYRHVNTLSPLKIGTLVCKTIINWQFGKRISVQSVKAVYVRVFQLGEGEYCENYRKISLIAFIGPAKGPQQAALLLCIVCQLRPWSLHITKQRLLVIGCRGRGPSWPQNIFQHW